MGLLLAPVTVEDDGATVKISGAGQNVVNFDKAEFSITRAGDQGHLIILKQSEVETSFYFEDVTSPVTLNAAALQAAIEAMKTESSAGAATAAKQDEQTALLQQIEANTSSGGTTTTQAEKLVQTNATGSTWQPLPDTPCTEVLLMNILGPAATGTTIEYSRGGTGTAPITVPYGTHSAVIRVNANANEVSVRRSDLSNTQYTFPFIYESPV